MCACPQLSETPVVGGLLGVTGVWSGVGVSEGLPPSISPLCGAAGRGQSAADPATEPAGPRLRAPRAATEPARPRLRAPRAARLGSVIKGLLLAFRASVSTAVKRGSSRSHGRAVRCSVRMYKVRAWPGRCPTRGSLCLCVSSLGQGGLPGAVWSG